MLYTTEACTSIKQGDVFNWSKPKTNVPTNTNLTRSKLHIGPRCVVVSSDDYNIMRDTVLIAPICRAKSNKQLMGEDEVGRVQYIHNGVMYTIFVDEVQPVDKTILTEKAFSLSSGLMTCVSEIYRSLVFGFGDFMKVQETKEDFANVSDDCIPQKVVEEQINAISSLTEDLNRAIPSVRKKIVTDPGVQVKPVGVRKKASEIKTVPEPSNEDLAKLVHDKLPNMTHPHSPHRRAPKVTSPRLQPTDKTKLSDDEFMEEYIQRSKSGGLNKMAERLGCTILSIEQKASRIKRKNTTTWDDEIKIGFLLDFEAMKKGTITEENFTRKYKMTIGQSAREYANLTKSE